MVYKTALAVAFAIGILVTPGVAELTDAVLSAPVGFLAEPGDYVTIPLTLTGTGTLDGCDVRITYDPAVLELPNLLGTTTTDITAGSLIPGWSVTSYLPSGHGLVNVSSYGSLEPVNPSGTVFNVYFHVLSSADLGVTPIGLVDYAGWEWDFQSGSINVVPEPSSLVLLTGLLVSAAFAALWRKRQPR